MRESSSMQRGLELHERMVKASPWGTGLQFLKRSSDGSLIVAYRHWPHLLCWSWSIDLRFFSKEYDFARWKPYFYRSNSGYVATVRFGFGQISLHRQFYEWMSRHDLQSMTEQ